MQGYINGDPLEGKDESELPVVTRYELPYQEDKDKRKPEVLKVENAMGKQYINKFVAEYSRPDVLFHRGQRGRTGLYMCFVTNKDPRDSAGRVAYFQIGKGDSAMRYACQKALTLETDYLSRINSIAKAAHQQ